MDVRHHGADVASAVGLAAVLRAISNLGSPRHSGGSASASEVALRRRRRRYLRELLLLQILRDGGLEVFGVALVQAVNLAALLDPHVAVHQDELAEGLGREGRCYTSPD